MDRDLTVGEYVLKDILKTTGSRSSSPHIILTFESVHEQFTVDLFGWRSVYSIDFNAKLFEIRKGRLKHSFEDISKPTQVVSDLVNLETTVPYEFLEQFLSSNKLTSVVRGFYEKEKSLTSLGLHIVGLKPAIKVINNRFYILIGCQNKTDCGNSSLYLIETNQASRFNSLKKPVENVKSWAYMNGYDHFYCKYCWTLRDVVMIDVPSRNKLFRMKHSAYERTVKCVEIVDRKLHPYIQIPRETRYVKQSINLLKIVRVNNLPLFQRQDVWSFYSIYQLIMTFESVNENRLIEMIDGSIKPHHIYKLLKVGCPFDIIYDVYDSDKSVTLLMQILALKF